MFLVFNKQKIFSYLVAFTTVIALLGVAKIYTNKASEIIDTMANAKNESKIYEQPVINNQFSNCLKITENWNDTDINQLLILLKKYNIKMKFYVTKEWKDKHVSSINLISNYGHEIIEYEKVGNE